jgi:acyl dehydratase
MVGLSVEGTTLGTLIANLGFDRIVLPKPVFIGDTLRCESTVTALRESRSRPEAGIATWEHRLFNQRDEIVCQGLRTALLKKAPAA